MMDKGSGLTRVEQSPPSGFSTVKQIFNLPSQDLKAKVMVNIIGFVRDYQPPFQTRGGDFKCTLEIVDPSVQGQFQGIKANIFGALEKMPQISSAGDAVIIRNIKAQMWTGSPSLLSHFSSILHVLPAPKIATSLPNVALVPWSTYPPSKTSSMVKPLEMNYVIWAHEMKSEFDLPSESQFVHQAAQAMNLKDKFQLLKDVKPDSFCDILGEAIKVFDNAPEWLTLYLSDYTAHSQFYNYVWDGDNMDTIVEDDFGYVQSRSKSKKGKDWPGPYGKMTIQLTVYDGHATTIREELKIGQWVLLKNVQVKYGKQGGCLEGFLRGDKDAFSRKTQVTIMKKTHIADLNEKRLKEGARRKYDWVKKFRAQKMAILNDAAGLGRSNSQGIADETKKPNSRKRRKERRAAAENKIQETEQKKAKESDLNENIRCAFSEQQTVPLAEVMELQDLHADTDRKSPFTLCKYRADIRVVDYFPDSIDDFAIGHRGSELDMLSDYSGGEDTDLEEDRRMFKSGKGFKKDEWQWRFALYVEDIDAKDSRDRLWLMVDNQAAQMLLGLEEDATNLREDRPLLERLKEQLFKLWGDLEELKTARLKNQRVTQPEYPLTSSFNSELSSPPRHRAGDMPDDSDAENDTRSRALTQTSSVSVLQNRDVNGKNDTIGVESSSLKVTPKNKAFTCGIKQYAVKVEENDPAKANAGEGQRWQRMFALFGTQIL